MSQEEEEEEGGGGIHYLSQQIHGSERMESPIGQYKMVSGSSRLMQGEEEFWIVSLKSDWSDFER